MPIETVIAKRRTPGERRKRWAAIRAALTLPASVLARAEPEAEEEVEPAHDTAAHESGHVPEAEPSSGPASAVADASLEQSPDVPAIFDAGDEAAAALAGAVVVRFVAPLAAFELSTSTVSGTGGSCTAAVSAASAERAFEAYLLRACRRNPSTWLPVEQGLFKKLQAKLIQPGAARAAPVHFRWMGLLDGGGGLLLPFDYLEPAGFTRSLIRRCMDKSPMPVDCTDAGAAAPIAPLDQLALWSAPALSTLSVGAPLVYWTQAGKEFCVAYSVASAVHHCGDEAAARRIANLAERVLQQPAGTDRVTWLAVECRQQLQPAWSVRSLDTTVDPLTLLAGDRSGESVTMVQLRDSSGNLRHCVASARGWLFDPNKTSAVQLSRAGLDACCLGAATFHSIIGGFRLVRTAGVVASRPQSKTHFTCSSCKELKPRDAFSRRQLKKGTASVRCMACAAAAVAARCATAAA